MTLFYIAYGSCSAQNIENHTESIQSILSSRPSLWNSFLLLPFLPPSLILTHLWLSGEEEIAVCT